MKISDIKPEVFALADSVEAKLQERFYEIDAVAKKNTLKVMEAFQHFQVSEACFAGTTGYGYDDLGRDTLDKIYARVFGAEAALVRTGFVNGTHALTTAMFALVKPGDTIVALTGLPYDTLRNAIGITGNYHGSLKFYGIHYAQVDLLPDGNPDLEGIKAAVLEPSVTACMIQRSRGYDDRKALTVQEIGEIICAVKSVRPDVNVMVDNCYGEFTDVIEPTEVGADIMAGSLIKNPGGGVAPTGGYVAGRAELVDNAALRLTTPGIGGECGSTNGLNRLLYQGFFMAPHVTAQALKTAVFCAGMMEACGIDCSPASHEKRSDIIEMIRLKDPEKMKGFCIGIQAGAPVDSFVTPIPAPMPGYDCDVIMAAGAFVQGSSIELSADGPFKPPYTVYMQGGITYESGRLGIMMATSAMM